MSLRTTEQLLRIKQLIVKECDTWLSNSNTVIVDNGKEKLPGMGQVYVTIVNEGQKLEPYGDSILYVTTSVGVYVNYSLSTDMFQQFSKLTTVITDKAEEIIDCLHMRYDSLWCEPIKLSSAMKVDIDRNSNWAVCGLTFDVLQVQSYLR